MTVCKNCALEFEGKYCPECGQKASTKRFTTRILLKDVVKKVFPLDRGVLYTTRRLLSAPGLMLREYLDGKRVNYTKPLQFLLLVVAVSLLLFSKSQFEQGFQEGYGHQQNEAILQIQKQMMDEFFSHLSLIFVTLIPFLALFSKWFFRKQDLNFAEHLVLNCYLMAGCSIASMPFTVVMHLLGANPFVPVFTAISTVIYLLFFAWAYVGFFKPRNPWAGGLKAILVFLLAYLVYILVLGLLVGLGVGVYLWIWGK